MPDLRRSRRLLARLERLHAVERQEALTRLAETRAEQRRMEDIASRSRMLAGGGALAGGTLDGAGLAAVLAFQARLTSLVSDARRMGERASAAETVARAGFAEADRRLERVRERRQHADRKADEQQMARSLLDSSQKPRGLF
ncbi:hypothetical protein U4960_06470 [Altererythrobacter sp. H2]|uniref:hypothetical protein n=1 Tax=Altererythrobacter sp. H2 TaxID=3108391 RepID=UPI002B4BDCBD|nr:hypothetical protein [Altererythrobacter sp. H2]WRK96956.1 hypothetical protein U4960_06470 [Altererythrobacter sp. H2]